jgi:hypothetical protein
MPVDYTQPIATDPNAGTPQPMRSVRGEVLTKDRGVVKTLDDIRGYLGALVVAAALQLNMRPDELIKEGKRLVS